MISNAMAGMIANGNDCSSARVAIQIEGRVVSEVIVEGSAK